MFGKKEFSEGRIFDYSEIATQLIYRNNHPLRKCMLCLQCISNAKIFGYK